MRDLHRIALFDGDVRAIRNLQIQRGERRRDVKRNIVVFRENSDGIGSNFVCDIAVGRDPVGSHNDSIDQTLTHERPGHVVGNDPHIDVVFP